MMPAAHTARVSSGCGENAIIKNSLSGRQRIRRYAVIAAMLAASGNAAHALADTWLGTVNTTWDTTTRNWDGSGYFGNGDAVVFDDSQTSVFNINITPASVSPGGTSFYFYNNDTFTFSGGPIGSFNPSGNNTGAFDLFNLGNTGTVVLDNSAVYATSYYVDSGEALVVGPGTQLYGIYSRTSTSGQVQSTETISVSNGGTLQFQAGATLNAYTDAGLTLTDSGTVEVASGATITGALTGGSSGDVRLDGGGATWISQYSTFKGTLTGSGTYSVTDNPQPGGYDYAGAGIQLQSPASLQLTSGSALSSSNGAYIMLVGANTGSAGYGAGITAYVSGTGYYGPGSGSKGPAPAGALRGSASVSNNWLGNVVVPTTLVSGSLPDPTAISGGYGGTLTISGTISGGDPIAFSPQFSSTTIVAGSNTYAGETRIASTYLSAGTLALGAANAIPAASGISFAGGGTSTFDLGGYSTSTAYLTTRAAGGAGYNAVGTTSYNGSNSTNVITNSGLASATLTDAQTGTMTYAGSISDGASTVALAFTGSGNQILTGSNIFSGGTTISSGTVTAGAAAALGTGSVVLGGGTLFLAATSPTNAITNFSTRPFTLNQGAGGNGPSVSGSTLTLTDTNTTNEANSAFTTSPVALGAKGFSASFNLSFNSPQYVDPTGYTYSGGVTLTLENDPNGAHAVGGSGNGLGYTGIQNSAALEISTRQNLLTLSQTDNNRLGTVFQTGGASANYATGYNDVRGADNVDENYNVTLTYNALSQTLLETLDGGTSNTASFFYSHVYTGVNLSSILGTNSPYIGFTGGSGGAANFSVSNFSFNNLTGTTTPTSIANGLTAAAGTTSAISLGTSAGNLGATIGSLTVGTNATLAVSSVSSDGTTTPGVLTTPSASIAAGGTLTFASSADAIVQNAVTNAGNVVFAGAGSNALAGVTGAGTLYVGAAATVTAGTLSQGALVNNGVTQINGAGSIGQLTGTGTLGIGTNSTNNTVQLTAQSTPNSFTHTQSAVTIATGSTLDITNNTININYGSGTSPLAAVANAVAYGAGAGTATNANGSIISSTVNAGTPGKYAVGYADAAEDANVPTGNVAIMYTLAGDNTLGGSVTFQDYSILQNSYGKPGLKDWYQGDYNHDGTVNFQDYSMLQNNYGKPGVSVASPLIQSALTTRSTKSAAAAFSLVAAGASPAIAHSVSPDVSSGPVITYLLSVNDDGSGGYQAGHFAVYATDTAPANNINYGIASYGFTLANATTVTNYGPQAQYFDQSKGKVQNIGFTANSSSANAAYVTGSQDTIDYSNGADVVLVYGIGQTAGNLANDASVPNFSLTSTQAVYGAPVEVAQGTFAGLAPTFTSTSTATGNYFDNNSGANSYYTDPATLAFTSQTLSGSPTPEPASLGVLGLGGVIMMRRRRKPNKA